MTGNLTPNSSETASMRPKTGQEHASFCQNEAVFCRNSFDVRRLPFWTLPGVFKACGDNDLRPILAATLVAISRKYQLELEMRRVAIFGGKRGCITNYN